MKADVSEVSYRPKLLLAAAFAAAIVVLALLPLYIDLYQIQLLTYGLIAAIAALGFNLLLGYTGLLSFGHSAFFGVGGYVAGLALTAHPGPVGALLLPVLASGLAALVIGFFSIRVSGVYFIMLTLAFSQMLYAYAFQNPSLGAEDGINGVPRPAILGVPRERREISIAPSSVMLMPSTRAPRLTISRSSASL